jgi:hypothetical protein
MINKGGIMPYKIINGEPKFYPEMVVKQDAKWRKETMKEFYSLYGHWYWFTGYTKRKYKNWIEQYDRGDNDKK